MSVSVFEALTFVSLYYYFTIAVTHQDLSMYFTMG